MFSPPTETFKTNKSSLIAAVVLAAVALGFPLYAYNPQSHDRSPLVFAGIVIAVFGLLITWLLSCRVSLHPEGISYQDLFRAKEMRWEDIERIYYSAVKRSVNFVPVGTYYRFKLTDGEGNKISFGNRIERPAEMGSRLLGMTYEPLFKKAARLFDSGEELDFGAVRVSRGGGIKVKKWIGFKAVPWNELAEYRIEGGHFYIFRVGEKRATGPALTDVPNAFILRGLLDAICQPKA